MISPLHLVHGTPVFVWKHGRVRHRGLVSDLMADGLPTVIHSSPDYGGVAETTWLEFSRGGQVHVEQMWGAYPPDLVIARARSWMGQPYHVKNANCEHLVEFAHGRPVRSPQYEGAVHAGAWLLSLGLLAYAFGAE